MSDTLEKLVRRVQSLEENDRHKNDVIRELENENERLEKRMKSREKLQSLRQDCVFSARMKSASNLGQTDPAWKAIDQVEMMYKTCRHFDALRGEFTAPVKGDYHMDVGVRQTQKGGLEVMLRIKPVNGDLAHAYIGRTSGPSGVCHKTMVLSLDPGDTVFGVVRRMSGRNADIEWCAFHGFLITAHLPHTHMYGGCGE